MNRNSHPKYSTVRYLTLAAVLIALAIVFTRFFSITTSVFRFGFGMLPIHFAGYLLGPVWGFAVGVISDLIGLLFNTVGSPHLGITLTTGLQGAIAGLVVVLMKNRLNPLTVVISGVLTSLICSLFLNSFWLSQLMGVDFILNLQLRSVNVLLQGLLLIVVEGLLVPVLYSVRKYLPGPTQVHWRWNAAKSKYDTISEQSEK